jgi:hypothetical protein
MYLGAASAAFGAASWASRLRMLGRWRRNTHGHHAIALRGVILVHPVPQMVAGRSQLHGFGNSNAWSKRPTWESTVLVRTRALWGSASVAAMLSFVVD